MWVYDNESARHLLLGFISNDLVKQFEQLVSAKETYDQIITKYDASTVSHLMEAFSNYVNYKMPEGTLINDHIDQMNIRLRNLIALGRDMDQELQRLYLLQSLPPSWENVSRTLSLQKTLTVKDIEAELIAEGQRQAARGVVPTALLAQTNSASGSMATMGKRKNKGKRKAKVQ